MDKLPFKQQRSLRKIPEKRHLRAVIVRLKLMESQGILNYTLAFVNPFFIGHSNADRILSVRHLKIGP